MNQAIGDASFARCPLRKKALFVLMIWALVFGLTSVASALTLDENCTATILNRTVQLNHQGGFAIPNVPVVDGKYRVRIVCRTPGGQNTYAVSDFFALVANGSTAVANLVPAGDNSAPVSITIVVPFGNPNLTSVGQSVQLNVRATLPASATSTVPRYRDVTMASEGTTYTTSNPKIATVGVNGLVTAVSRGQAVITARNEGAVSTVIFNIQTPVDSDADGMPDEWEVANGLNPNDPSDTGQDLDGDGLTNLQEFQYGTNPRVKDTDGDGVSDGDEIKAGATPLNPDTDGDGLLDGQEAKLGTNPLNADTDNDGIPDGKETKLGLNPKSPDLTTVVHGRIIGPDGNPVPGASATVYQYFTGNADETGVFNVPFVPAGIGNIIVQGSGISGDKLLSGQSQPIGPVADGYTDVGTIQLTVDSGVVFGNITYPNGQPVPGANVTVQSGPTLSGRNTTSDALGAYRVAKQVSGAVVVLATDPKTGLRARKTGTLPLNGNVNLDLTLQPTGKLTGLVIDRDGKNAGAGITVVISGPFGDTTKTDATSRYVFDYVPLGSYTIEASDTTGNRGRTAINLEFTGQTQKADVTFLGRGNVMATVVDGGNNPVPNATVSLNSRSVFGGSQSGTTDSSGVYTFQSVFVGDFTANGKSEITRLAGKTDGHLDANNTTVNVTIMLQASGSIKGTVVRHNGTTVVPGAYVQLSNGLNTTTDANGVYQFDFVPTGNYQVDVTDGNTGDRGHATPSVTQQDQVANGDVTLNGLGTVTVTVKDGGGNTVSGAQVKLNSLGRFAQTKSDVTAADGTVTLTNVLAGGYSVHAFNPANSLTGDKDDSVGVDQTQATTVTLQSAGTIKGKVYGPDGTTLIPNISVRLSGRATFTDENGQYVFTVVPAGTYSVSVFDAYNNIRAVVTGINLTQDAQVIQQDLTMVGIGTVTGTVLNPDQTPAPGIGVSLVSYAAGVGRRINGQTNFQGVYTITQVPVGDFTATASAQTALASLFGTADGNLAADGASTTADIQLTETRINIANTVYNLYDANGFLYDINQGGAIQNGYRRIFAGNFGTTQYANLLDVVVNGTPNRFAGKSFATKSLDGRELVLSQDNLAGLNVTRKILVPRDGYFTRYLELLTNPGSQPVTVDLLLSSYIRAGSQTIPSVVLTSSGDGSLDVTDPNTPDRWVVTDDINDDDPFSSPDTLVVQPVGFAFDGIGGTDRAQTGTFDNSNGTGTMQFGWKNITIQPGQTVGYMHFAFQQTSRAGSQASADRLGSLAPEALAGENLPALSTSVTDASAKWDSLTASSATYFDSFGGADNTYTTTNNDIVNIGVQLKTLSADVANFVTGGSTDISQIQAQATAIKTLAEQARNLILALPKRGFCLASDPNCTTTVQQGAPLVTNQANALLSLFVTLDESALDLLDLTTVRNWAVPFNANSAVAPLPGIGNGAKGRVFASDGATAIPRAPVTVQSTNPIFGRIYSTSTDGNGNYQLDSVFRDGGDTVALLFSEFNVQATHPLSKVQSPQILVPVVQDSPYGVQDISFTNTGIINGLVRRANGPVVSGGTVSISGDGLSAGAATLQIQTDGSYSVNGLPPGSYTMIAIVPHPQGTPLVGSTTGTVVGGQLTQGDIFLQVTGAISGTVRRASNSATVPNLVVNLHGPNFVRSTRTDTGGKFTFTDVPTGNYTIDSFDEATNSADSVPVAVSLDVTTTKDLLLQSGGTVRGIVYNPDNTLGIGLTVDLSGPGGNLTATTDANGQYSFQHVTPGNITVSCFDANTGFRGSNYGGFGLAGQVLQLDIKLYSNGAVTGTVLEADGTTPVPGVPVTIYAQQPLGTKTINADSNGKYTFNGVPIGNFTVDALKPNGDRGRVTNQVSTNGETRTVNVRLYGVGTVVATVKDASGNIVNNAHVQIYYNNNVFSGYKEGDTTGGAITFNDVLAGNYTLYARDNLTGLAGNKSDTLTFGSTKNTTVSLQPAGSITGIVQQTVNGTSTPVSGVTVRLFQYGSFQRQATTAGDGSFRFDSVPTGNSYSLDSLDAQNRIRARETNISLSQNGETVVRNLTFIGLGSVTGQVYTPSNAAAGANIQIQVRSLNPVIGGYFSGSTDDTGVYTITGVPVGNFTVTGSDFANNFYGDSSGQIANDGQTATADIHLLDNTINLPTNLYDVNGFLFDMQQNGSIANGTNNNWYGDGGSNYGAFRMSLFDSQGVETEFTGSQFGVTRVNGRQVDVRQNILGLDVTRSVFVPNDGYFVRYVELLSNPTTDPITVDLKLNDNHYCNNSCQSIMATSSGDANLDLSDPNNLDRWVIVDRSNSADPFRSYYNQPHTGYAFDGPNAADHADAGTYNNNGTYSRQLQLRWNGITVPPGGRVAYMHFAVQHTSLDNAQASVDRLDQLPPEALVGLTGDVISSIQNFNVPSSGISDVPALPALTGVVSGIVYGGDGSTPVPNITTMFTSSVKQFGRTRDVGTDSNGAFTFTGNVSQRFPIPIAPFTVSALSNNNTSELNSPASNGAFGQGQTSAVQNVAFTNAGFLTGVVRFSDLSPAANGGSVSAQRSPSYFYATTNIDALGGFRLPVVPAGNYTLYATVNLPNGYSLAGTQTAVPVQNGQVKTQDIILSSTASVSGVITNGAGNPASSVFVRIYNNSVYRSIYTDNQGNYSFTFVPAGVYTLEAYEPNNNYPTTVSVVLAPDQVLTQNLQLIGLGTVNVHVDFAGATPAPSAYVYSVRNNNTQRYFGQTDSAGNLAATNFPVGAGWSIRAYDYNNSGYLQAEAVVDLVSYGESKSVNLTFPATGVVKGTITLADGTPAINALVNLRDASGSYNRSVRTDSAGAYTFTQVIATGVQLTLRAYNPNNTSYYRDLTTTDLDTNGEEITLNVTLPALATVRVTVLKADDTPFGGVSVRIKDAFRTSFRVAGNTDATTGQLDITNVPEGAFTIQAYSGNTFVGSATGAVTMADNNGTVNVTVNAPFNVNVQGTITAANGTVPIPDILVYAYDQAFSYLGSTSTGADGKYTFSNILVGQAGIIIRVYLPNGGYIDTPGSATTPGETLTIDVTIPGAVIKGTVKYDDGMPSSYPNVFLHQIESGGSVVTVYGNRFSDGRYYIIGPALGDFLLFAQDNNSGIQKRIQGAVATDSDVINIDVTLPPTGTVSGTVSNSFKHYPNPNPNSYYGCLTVSSSGQVLYYDRYESYRGDGTYSVDHVPLGNITVQASDDYCNYYVNAPGILANANEIATVDLTLPDTGTVTGTVTEDGVLLPDTQVRIDNYDGAGPEGYFSTYANSDENGAFSITDVPFGTVRVTAYGNSQYGFTEQYFAPGSSPFNIPLDYMSSSFGYFDVNLDGSDGYRYSIKCDGSLGNGTQISEGTRAFDYGFVTVVNGQYPNCFESAKLDAGDRVVIIGQQNQGGLTVLRKAFSPPDGGWVRFTDSFTNNSSSTIDAVVQENSEMRAASNTTIVVDPSTNGNTVLVTADSRNCCSIPAGFVTGGQGSLAGSVAATNVYVPTGINYDDWNGDYVKYEYHVSVPAGATVVLVHYAIANADQTAATTVANSLASGTAAHQFEQMTDTEKQATVNFAVP